MVKKFRYTQATFAALEASLSADRLATYAAAANTKKEALELYTWNTALSSAFYGPLQAMEVAIRNSMHRELSAQWGPAWYDNVAIPLTVDSQKKIAYAKRACVKNGTPADPPHIVAELTFGFWVSILGNGPKGQYEIGLWRPVLHKAFPNVSLPRKNIHRPLDFLRTFRNRIAHHEPIFNRHLQADYANILTVTEWVCADTAAWIDRFSRVNDMLARRPPHRKRLTF